MLVAKGAGTYDFYFDGVMITQDLIDRNVVRPGEGLDVPPLAIGSDPEYEWEGGLTLAHNARSVRKSNKVNWTRNPSVEVDATLMAGYKTDASLVREAASRITPTRITPDADEGTASAEWAVVASATGQAILYLGDPENVPGTASPVHNQEITVTAASIKALLPAGAQAYLLGETFLRDGTRVYGKGYAITPDGSWQRMSVSGMEEFPKDAGATTVPNRPPRWAMAAFWLTGLPAGWTGTVRTDRGLVRRDHLGNDPGDAGYYAYFDGATTGAAWLGTAGLSASDLTIVTTVNDTTPPAVPTGLTAVGQQGAVSLDWADNPDGDLAGYFLLRDGVIIFDGTSSSFLDSRATPGVAYNYTVKAYDTSGNLSAASAAVSGTALAEPVPEPAPTPLSTDDWRGLITALTIPDLDGNPLDLLQGVKNISGLVGVTVDSVVRKRVGGHGSLINTKHRNDRVISISRTLRGNTADEAWAKYMAMSRAVSAAVDEDRLLSWTLGDNLLRLQSLVRLEELEAPVVASPNRLSTRIDFRCADPRAYSQASKNISRIGPGLMTANNAGTVGTLPHFVIQGPALNPLVRIGRLVLRVFIDLKVGNILQFIAGFPVYNNDSFDRAILLNGAERYDLLDVVASRWFELAPGDNIIETGGSNTELGGSDNAHYEVRWHHAYQ
jgi:hypothetical protein